MLSIIIGITLTLFRVRALTVIGFASWTQNAFTQSDADQDMLMVEACTNRYNVEPIGAATHSELLEMEIDNTSGGELLGICGDSTACKDVFILVWSMVILVIAGIMGNKQCPNRYMMT